MSDITSRAKTGPCGIQPSTGLPWDKDGSKWIPGGKNPKLLTCALQSLSKPKKGNYILYDHFGQNMDEPNILTVVSIQDDYCVPKLRVCQCEAMLNNIMNIKIATHVTMAQYIDEIEVLLFGSSILEPTTTTFEDRCLCLLKATWEAGFVYVQMEHRTNEACAAKIQMHAQSGYIDACNAYTENDCGFHTIKITKK